MRSKFWGTGASTLSEAQLWLLSAREEKEGAECPCCSQTAKVYSRSINGAMAHALLLIALGTRDGESDADGWLHVPTFLSRKTRAVTVRGGDFAKLRYWDLLEEQVGVREDGSSRVGFWRVTEKGLLFVLSRIKLPKYALVYNNKLLGFDGPDVGIRACLGRKFDYDEILSGARS